MWSNPLIGKTITAVWLAKDGGEIKFDLADGKSIIARCDGDCCSHTWINSLDTPSALIGTVTNAEDIDMPGSTNDGELKCYGLRITTEKGVCVIDYRNESNGYYGGNLSWPGDYHYGGVFGQNVSKGHWKKIASID